MLLARRIGGTAWLIPDEFRRQFAAQGFTRFDDPPDGAPCVTAPIELEVAMRLEQVTQQQQRAVGERLGQAHNLEERGATPRPAITTKASTRTKRRGGA